MHYRHPLIVLLFCLMVMPYGKSQNARFVPAQSSTSFDVAATNCLIDAELTVVNTSLGSPMEGPFVPGEIVTFEFEILNYRADAANTGNQCQWLQGVVPVFGNGWDPISFRTDGRPVNRSKPNENWNWFPEGEVGYNFPTNAYTIFRDPVFDRLAICSGQSPDCAGNGITEAETPMPAGWYVTTKDSRAPCDSPGVDPDDSWGIPQECNSNAAHGKFTFSLTVRDFDNPVTGCDATGYVDTRVEIYTFTDGEIGCFVGENVVCAQDPAFIIDTVNICVPSNPTIRYFNQRDPLCSVDEFNNYQLNMTSLPAYPEQTWPGCGPEDSIIRPHWITFVATDDQVRLEMQVDQCAQQGGVKWAVYELPCRFYIGRNDREIDPSVLGSPILGCGSVTNPTQGTLPINFDGAKGQVYGILVDGVEGNLCQLNFNNLSGGSLQDLSQINLSTPTFDSNLYGFTGDTVCLGAEDVLFTVDALSDACRYRWILETDSGDIAYEFAPEVRIDFPRRGNYRLCVFASNFCSSTPQACLDFVVAPSNASVILQDTVCEGDSYIWRDTEGEVIRSLPPQNQPGLQQFTEFLDNAGGCSVTANLDLFVRAENNENPTFIDTVACYEEVLSNPLVFYCDTLAEFGLYANQNCLSPNTGCDTFFNIQYDILGGPLSIATECDGDGHFLFSYSDPGFSGHTPWEGQIARADTQPLYRLEWRWTTADGLIDLGEERILRLSDDELRGFALQDSFRLRLELNWFVRGNAFCSSVAELSFALSDQLPTILGLQGDTDYCLGVDTLSFGYTYTNALDPLYTAEHDSVFIQFWSLPRGFSIVPPTTLSSPGILAQPPADNPGTELCVEVVTQSCRFRDRFCTTLEQSELPVEIVPADSCGQHIYAFEGFEEGGPIQSIQWSVQGGRIEGPSQSRQILVEATDPDSMVLSVQIRGNCLGVGRLVIENPALNALLDPEEAADRAFYRRVCDRGRLLVLTEEACALRWGFIDSSTQEVVFPLQNPDGQVRTASWIDIPDTVNRSRQYFVVRQLDCGVNCASELIQGRMAEQVRCTSEAEIELYPNPNHGIFKLSYTHLPKGSYTLRLYNAGGQFVQALPMETTEQSGEYRWIGAALAAGLYHLEVRRGPQLISTHRMLIIN